MQTSDENKTSEEIIKLKIASLMGEDNWGEKELSLRGLNLTTLPDALSVFEKANALFDHYGLSYMDLEVLDLSENKFTSLPDFKYPGLKKLSLANNKLVSLPPLSGGLNWLDLSGNKISQLSLSRNRSYNLVFLNAANNSLTALPEEIGKLTKLESLDLSSNQISDLPKSIRNLVSLKHLNLSNNNLTALPEEVGGLTNLESLDLSGNQINELPSEITELSKLKTVNLSGNPLPIPPEILEKVSAPSNLFEYYFDKTQERLLEAKVLFVGQGGVGKTSIIHRLLDNTYNPNELQTKGIDIRKYTFTTKNSRYTINVWDFGGQEIMHATHQFFLTNRSLYLLIVDARLTQEENRVEYWLKVIQSFGGNSPVCIVGNKTDQLKLDFDRTGLIQKYPNIVDIIETSALDGRGIDHLQRCITKQIMNMPQVHNRLPKTWFEVKKALENLRYKENFISFEAYVKLCIENKVIKKSSQMILLGLLHDLGIILYFQDDPRLKALGILNPHWVTSGVYKILNDYRLFLSRGVLTTHTLDEILDSPEYPEDKRIFIVDVMRKFELCYDLDPNHIFLIPDLLQKDGPDTGDWSDALAFQYHYTVLPSSIITRFIVRMHAFIHSPNTWRSGTLLTRGNNSAMVKADYEDRKVYIWVRGNQSTRRDFLAAITTEFDAIHKTISGIEVQGKVPVPGHSNIAISIEHLYKLEKKILFEGMSDNTYVPEGLDEAVSVHQLLDGIAERDKRLADFKVSNPDLFKSSQHPESRPILVPIQTANQSSHKSFFLKAIQFIFISIPKAFGNVILVLFGRSNTDIAVSVIIGYVIIGVVILFLANVITLDMFREFINFFSPSKP